MKQPIFSFEPKRIYNKAIISRLKDGRNVYSYGQLIDLTMKHFCLGNEDDARDWVDYNMLPSGDSKKFKIKFDR